ncbi:CTP synthase (glutamine hydrolyzing) [Candidatus Woesearchaeota archaeon]|nr:CTP synthase (glutamine hydrolyzing) [Candidatus Woesearchaeota archaeon]
MTKYIVVAGGVISGVGKGITTASIGKILKDYGYKVTAIKIDPYLNYDAGTLRPTEHGEVWVTDDGGEIDQDLGNYERFLGMDIPKKNNITSGQIYKTVIDKERKGEFLGKTVQFIPHIPGEILRRIKDASNGFDFALIEIGGTIGDFENIAFLFAMKRLEREIGKENVIYILVTYLPIPGHMGEMKTKPTQQAIRMLSENGIFPDFIICRSKKPLDDVRKKKIETYANIPSAYVISEPDIDTVYRIPLDLENENLGLKILSEFRMKLEKKPTFKELEKIVGRIIKPKKRIKIAMVGKYVDIGNFTLKDSYISINESLIHAGASLDVGVDIDWIDAKKLEKGSNAAKLLKPYKGIIIPGGFGASGVEGKISAIKYARENNIPFLGLCYGLQLAVVEFARNVAKLEGANTTENDKNTKYPVIDILPTQKEILGKSEYGGTMRLGAYAAKLEKGSKVYGLYKDTGRIKEDKEKIEKLKADKTQSFRLGQLSGGDVVLERHRHRYEVNPAFIDQLHQKGLLFSGHHIREDSTKLMEFIELPKHPFFIATQAHPEFKSRLEKPAPLFYGFVRAAAK